ncbi:D-alanyl-D-alanine carboxypeptidase family protein [Thermoleptolyngbya sp. C42_A2020_037]|uniref:M15 family metallopeptidase n=1 Tax=Thermoleptolyngbya sp. C42_A2020_037 TaxID=2747799 RepID=UPI0025DB15DA|nr:M15 family metallopeptidase [Thermoleptolyngbya sp. C42_A2020_037]
MKDASLPKSSAPQPDVSRQEGHYGLADDIPVAQRDGAHLEADLNPGGFGFRAAAGRLRSLFRGRVWLWGLIGFVAAVQLALVSRSVFFSNASSGQGYQPIEAGLSAAMSQLSLTPADSLLGHIAYAEAPPDTLSPVLPNGSVLLRDAAAEHFLAMVRAARAERVRLVPLSGFRSVEEQTYLFFTLKAKRSLSAQERAQVSAPPGYSEHHTGYAVDIGDGDRPDTDLEIDFDQTAAYRWLTANAARFGFELSFPKNNAQGVSYEPWHWRFVGDRHSLETFYKR